MAITESGLWASEGYVPVCAVGDIPKRGKKVIRMGNMRLLLVACEEGLFAVEDSCPQTGLSIAHGKVIDGKITTPTNGARYSLETGQYVGSGVSPLQSHWLTVFPLRVVGDQVCVRLPVR